MTGRALMTADELLRLNLPNKRTELIRGHLVVREPAGGPHGEVALSIGALIWAHVRANKLGKVFAAETGFRIEANPDTVRAPDVAFVRAGRLPTPLERGYPKIAPDLAVEVLSPDDRPRDVTEKVRQWIGRGTQLVWVIDPEARSAQVYRANGSEGFVNPNGWLDGEAVLQGFRIELRMLFD